MKSIKNILLIAFLFSLYGCQSQKPLNDNVMNSIVSKNFEKFPNSIYQSRKDARPKSTMRVLLDGTYLELDEGDYGKSYIIAIPNSYFKLTRVYYTNGNIKSKGLEFNWFAFQKGIWFEFNVKGELVREINFDKNYKFTFEEVLEFCKREGIEVKKGPILQSTGYHTQIIRNYSKITESGTWTISWLKKPDIVEDIVLEGDSGKIISRKESGYINN